MNSFYTEEELKSIGFKSVGHNVLISRKTSFYGVGKMSIGNHVRIDDFCILSGEIILGSYFHISAYNALYGAYGIEMEDYTGFSPRCTIFSASDDFSGNFLISPMVENELTHITGGKILIKKYSQLGSGCVIMPGITINEGVAVGAMSFINKNLDAWNIYAGIPAKRIKEREKGLLDLLKR